MKGLKKVQNFFKLKTLEKKLNYFKNNILSIFTSCKVSKI